MSGNPSLERRVRFRYYLTAIPMSAPSWRAACRKNRLIGVMDIESEHANYFREEHLHLLTLTARASPRPLRTPALYAVSRQAQTLSVLNEVA